MPSLGITGTVGSGKSLALQVVAELGAETIQADRIGHQLLESEDVRREVVQLLGSEVLGKDGSLDRKKIGKSVFSDKRLLAEYNRIIHPRLLKALREWLERPRAAHQVVAVEAALIPEWGIEEWFDEVWCIRCSDEIALSRWGRSKEIYWQIREAQLPPQEKWAKAERVINNERSQEEYRRRVETEFRSIQGKCGHGSRGRGGSSSPTTTG